MIKAPPFILPLRIPASKEGPSSPSILFAHTPLPGSVTEHIRAARARGMGVGGGQAAAIVLRVLSPPPSPSSPTLTGLRSPQRHQTKAPQSPTRRSPLPPRRSFLACSPPSLSPHCPPFSPIPGRKARASTSGAAGPGAASRAPPCSSSRRAVLGEGPGQGLRDRGSTSWCDGTYCRQGRRASRNWKARSRESQT